MGTWLKHEVITIVNAPIDKVWNTWSDLDSMSLWMSWIESVKTLDQETSTLPDLTEWTLSANGFNHSVNPIIGALNLTLYLLLPDLKK